MNDRRYRIALLSTSSMDIDARIQSETQNSLVDVVVWSWDAMEVMVEAQRSFALRQLDLWREQRGRRRGRGRDKASQRPSSMLYSSHSHSHNPNSLCPLPLHPVPPMSCPRLEPTIIKFPLCMSLSFVDCSMKQQSFVIEIGLMISLSLMLWVLAICIY